jgi:hypothetical protein
MFRFHRTDVPVFPCLLVLVAVLRTWLHEFSVRCWTLMFDVPYLPSTQEMCGV